MNEQDRDEFSQFMVSRWPGLVRLAYGLTGDRWLAEDLAQAALASACTSWWRVRRAENPDAYVRKIMINAAHRRFGVHRRSAAAEHGREELEARDHAPLADARSDLVAALRELPPRQRAVIVLKYWADLSDAQVAELLGCSEGTVRSQAWRALSKLKTSPALARPEGGQPGGAEGGAR